MAREFEEGELDEESFADLVESTRMESHLHPEKTGAELAEEILEQAAPLAAASIVRIATSDPNTRVRLSASQYIVDRVLGKAGQDPTKNAPWNDVLMAVTVSQG